MSQSRARSTLESTIEYQNSQVSLSKIMKYLFLTLFAALILLVTYTFMDNSPAKIERIDKSGWTMYDRFKYSAFDITPTKTEKKIEKEVKTHRVSNDTRFFDGLKDLWSMDKSCNHLKELEQKLKSQKYSVQSHIDHFPSLDEIRNNRDKYELTGDLSTSCLDGEFDWNNSNILQVVSGFDKVINSGNLSLQSTQEDFNNVNEQLIKEGERYSEAERLLDNDFVYSVKGDVNDLINSQKNLQEKKVRLNSYRYALFNYMKQLESVVDEIKKIKSEHDSEKNNENDLNSKLAEAESIVNKYEKMMKEKEGSMGDRQQKELAEIRQLNDRIEEVRASIANQDKIKNECRLRRDRITKNKNHLTDAETAMNNFESQLNQLQTQKRDKNNSMKNLQDNNEILQSRKNIHTIKLEVLLRNKEIKAFLDKLLNSQTNIDNLTNLVNSKISNEEKLMMLMSKYNEESKKMDELEGKTIVDIETVTSDQVKSKIEKDKEDFRQIMEKYLGLKKVVDEYEDPDLEIRNLKVKIDEIDKKRNTNTNEQNKLKSEIDRLDKQIDEIDNRIKSFRDKNSSIKSSIDQDEVFIKEKEEELLNAQKLLDELLGKKDILDKKYKVS